MGITKFFLGCLFMPVAGLSMASEPPATMDLKPLRLLVGYAPASGADIVARLIGQKLSAVYPKGVVIENKPGAGGVLASKDTVSASPDGYTMLMAAMPQMTILPFITTVPYDVKKDFVPVSQIVATDLMLVSGKKNVDVTNFADFLKLNKDKTSLFFGTPGPGTVGHFASYIYADTMNVEVEPIHYKTTGDQVTGLQSGDIQAQFFSDAAALPIVKAGVGQPLMSTGPVRSAFFPDVPTAKEMGYDNLELASWYGIFAPSGTPDAVVELVGSAIQNISKDADYVKKMQDAGLRITGAKNAEFNDILDKDTAKWKAVIQASGFKSN